MFYWRKEGQKIKQGFNVYRLDDKRSAGFVLKIWRFMLRIRYSKYNKQWHCNTIITDRNGFYER